MTTLCFKSLNSVNASSMNLLLEVKPKMRKSGNTSPTTCEPLIGNLLQLKLNTHKDLSFNGWWLLAVAFLNIILYSLSMHMYYVLNEETKGFLL